MPENAFVFPPSSGMIREHDVPDHLAFTCAVASAQGPRDSMEDTHSVVVPFAGIHGQGLFAIFDGHGGKEAAKWCNKNYPKSLSKALQDNRSTQISRALKQSFNDVDQNLTDIWAESDGQMKSGCTAVVAFLRLEDDHGKQSFVPSEHDPLAVAIPGAMRSSRANNQVGMKTGGALEPPANVKRVLYCANVGDSRAVLCRGGKATRMTYDHKASDKREAQRIEREGGMITGGRVDGVLIPTRVLGDPEMNHYVTSNPYTSEVQLDDKAEFLILACDGLWDVIEDQEAVDLVRGVCDAMEAAQRLLNESKRRKTSDNVTVLVVRLRELPEDVA
ncbi:protein serine/threonine phosphatase 2C [Trametes polyzona]|nr:protein serine/threonine phosphatase 2C [Trametes polyzona]